MGVIGFVFGLAGLSIGLMAYMRIASLEKKLKEQGTLPEDFDSEKNI